MPAGTSASSSYAAIANERLAILEAVLHGLTDSDREVVTLARLARLPTGEIARRIGKAGAAVRQQLGRALVRLSAVLAERGDVLGLALT